MTLGIILCCEDGVVVGSDRKAVRDKGVSIQSKHRKIEQFSLEEPLLCCIAGSRTDARRALAQIDPERFNGEEPLSFHEFLTDHVERIIPQFAADYQEKHGRIPNFQLGFGTIANTNPIATTVFPTGQFDYEHQYTAIGSGSLLAEHFLRDRYCNGLGIDDARKYVGYIIQRVAEIDSNVEGVDVLSIDSDGNIESLSPTFKTALQAFDVFDFDFSMNIQNHMDQLDSVATMFANEAEDEIPDEDSQP